MRRSHAARLGLGCALVLWVSFARVVGGQASGPGDAATQSRSLDRGVYSSRQAERGKAHYTAFCEACHLADLSGTLAADTGAPPLRGVPFMDSLGKTGVVAFFDHVKATMPFDDPGTLKDTEYLEILTYLFEANGFPPGSDELTLVDLPRLRTPDRTR